MQNLTRRQLTMASSAALAVAAMPKPARAQLPPNTRVHVIDMGNAPFFDRAQSPTGLDGMNACTQPNHKFLDSLTYAGVDTVIRYYSDTNNAGLNCKNVTRRERDVLNDHGLALCIVYQHEGRAKNRYTGARADQDARFCLERARAIGQPEGSSIYFGVDSDAALNSDQGVLDYFREVNRIFGGRYRVGIYAAGARCQLIRNAGLAEYFWVPEAPAWAGTRDFMNTGNWTMYQNKTDIHHSLLTRDMDQPLAIDTDILNPLVGDTIGAFRGDGSIVRYDPMRLDAIARTRKWVTQDQLDIYYEPDDEQIAHACIARMVHVLEDLDGWALVDIDEDGYGDGFCRSDTLADLGSMPRWRRSSCKPMKI
ncbi:MAG: DUF1906 domain-containing protein [Paracoccaceae bacterium]